MSTYCCCCRETRWAWPGGADLVEELEELGAGLVDGADDGSSSLSESFEQRDDLETRRAVQAADTHRNRKLVKLRAQNGQLSVSGFIG